MIYQPPAQRGYAAELARVSVWIGEIQWMIGNGFGASTNPILKPLETIECRDALMTWVPGVDGQDGKWVEAEWPEADAIIGNPPFIGQRFLRRELGEVYVTALRRIFRDRLSGNVDLVAYWFAKAHRQMAQERAGIAGLVATNSIRGGDNRAVLSLIAETLHIFNAWADEPWVNEGAAVRVSLICFSSREMNGEAMLDGLNVQHIGPDLTSTHAVDSGSLEAAAAREAFRMGGVGLAEPFPKSEIVGHAASP